MDGSVTAGTSEVAAPGWWCGRARVEVSRERPVGADWVLSGGLLVGVARAGRQ